MCPVNPFPRDTDDLVPDPLHVDRRRQDILRAAEPPLPEGIANHRNGRRTRPSVGCVVKRPSLRDVDTHHLKVIGGNKADADLARLLRAPQWHLMRAHIRGGCDFEEPVW